MSKPIEVIVNVSESSFKRDIYRKRVPVLIRGVDIGPCKYTWNSDYLSQNVGNKEVKIHVSDSPKMDFLKKNFLYKTLPFDELLRRASKLANENHFISEKEFYYLRSLGDNPRKDVSDIRQQFPSVGSDIKFPEFYEEENLFSSVFRVSSAGVTLWTHYDIMDNLLIQVVGHKKAILFHPDDVPYLYMNGDKSEVTDLENPDFTKYPNFSKATPYECTMEPGDILFIPALWFHNMTALEFGVAVNVFWKHLAEEFYDKKDPYGNKDLLPAKNGLSLLDKGLNNLNELPEYYRRFYALRMIERIKKTCL